MTAAIATTAGLPGRPHDTGIDLPPGLPFDVWERGLHLAERIERASPWDADQMGKVVKLQGGPGRDYGPAEASTTRLFGSPAMRFDPTTLSPLPTAEKWWPRFVSKFEVVENGCWLWRRHIDRDGYGRFGINSTVWYAHRAAYVALIGPIPDETLDHLCHTNDSSCPGALDCLHRRCVNPWHCEPATNIENVMRGGCIMAQRARQTHCKNGHPLSGDNLYQTKDGRHCKTCRLANNRAAYARKRGAA